MKVFVDTGAFLGRYLRNDQYHQRALALWSDVKAYRLLTSNLVISETLTLLTRWVGTKYALEKAGLIYHHSGIEIMRPTVEDELNALICLERYSDQVLSFTDCVSFVLMKCARIKHYFGFDKHFQMVGFESIAKDEPLPK